MTNQTEYNNATDPKVARMIKSAFDEMFDKLDAPDYPATCHSCGEEGTNATMASHICPMTREFVAQLREREDD